MTDKYRYYRKPHKVDDDDDDDDEEDDDKEEGNKWALIHLHILYLWCLITIQSIIHIYA